MTTTNRHAFNHITKHTILIDLKGQPMRCAFCSKRNAVHVHHNQYVCNGGTNDLHNLTGLCAKCHINYHSKSGDFAVWGSKGGKATAASGKSLKNLKQYQNREAQ